MQLSEEELVSVLGETIFRKYQNNQALFADAHDISRAYLNDVLNERRKPGKKILDALGYKKVVTYVLED
jgi:hypothetical protein